MKAKVAASVAVILALACFGPADAQQTAKTKPRVGFIVSTGNSSPGLEGFLQELRDLGYVDGQNILIE